MFTTKINANLGRSVTHSGKGDELSKLVVALSAGAAHVCVIVAGGTLKCWGNNSVGQFGNGTNMGSTSFTTSQHHRPEQVSIGSNGFSCARNLQGEVRCAGNNASGQLGLGSTMSSFVPVLAAVSDVTQVETGTEFACALKGDGTVWCWGRNQAGQLGDGTSRNRFAPTRVAF